MRTPPFLIGLALASLAAAPVGADAPLVRARLAPERTELVPGTDNWLALHLRMREGWHVYWQNPGDSGLPPRLEWRLPDGATVAPIAWPAPERFALGPLASFGYEDQVHLPMRVTIGDPLAPGDTVRLAATARILVCKVDCVPEEAEVALDLPVTRGGGVSTDDADAIRAALATVPRATPGWSATIVQQDARSLGLRATLGPGVAAADHELFFFPEKAGLIEPAAEQPVTIEDGAVTLRLTKAAMRQEDIATLRGALVARRRGNGIPPVAVALAASVAPAPADRGATAAPPLRLPMALGLAFAGGLLLNLMPCVFPVLAIKVLGFVRDAGGSRRRATLHALAFAAGIMVSFWILAGALLALRAGGAEIGWGFQLQSPPVVLALAFLFFVLALVFLGALDVGTRLTAVAGGVRLPGGRPAPS